MPRFAPVLLLLCLPLSACVATHFDDPINVITSHVASEEKRQAAERQAEAQTPNDPRFAQALQTLLWEPHYNAQDRIYAIKQLITINEPAFRKDVSRRLLLIQNYEVLLYVFRQAVDRHWTDFTPAVVRSYTRTIHGLTDAQRPERRVIEQLNPGKTVDQVIFATFANTNGQSRPEEQAAAWELINRLIPRQQVLAVMDQAPDSTPMVNDLKAAALDLHTVPVNREGVLWLAYLRDPARKAWWDRAKALVATLNSEQQVGLELRHLPILMQTDAPTMKMTRDDLIGELRRTFAAAEHHLTSAPLQGQDPDYPQRFEQWVDKLAWADLVAIRYLNAAVQDRAVVAELFNQAMADHEDTSTEFGGVINIEGAGTGQHFAAHLYEPEIRINDVTFLPPPAMVEELYTGLAHYHFHAQRIKNSEYAGPGRGDLETAGNLNFNFLVFTFIDEDRLNVDYYSRGGIVVDLGTLHRQNLESR